MKPVNIFALTRALKTSQLGRLEKQMSQREHPLRIREWEMDSLRGLIDELRCIMPDICRMNFFFSFQIPKLGKEMDLLRISDETIVNIELKSKEVPEENIRNQLLRNKYYLALLGKDIRSYTYVCETGKLFRLSRSEKLKTAEWSELAEDLKNQTKCFEGNIEELFREDEFLISPLTDPERFLLGDYFLTSQQRDIKDGILKHIRQKDGLFFGFTGLPGTGKTLLLYDIAMSLTQKAARCCVLHFGSFPPELHHLDERLKRIDFFHMTGESDLPELENFNYICVDEGHRITRKIMTELSLWAKENAVPVIFSYDIEDAVAPEERHGLSGNEAILLEGMVSYRMTNRIRMNSELSSFVRSLLCRTERHRKDFPSVQVLYSGNKSDTGILLENFKDEGYIFVKKGKLQTLSDMKSVSSEMSVADATCREFEKVIMIIDHNYYYDERGYLRSRNRDVREIYHGLSRAKNKLALIVEDNDAVFESVLGILQGEEEVKR